MAQVRPEALAAALARRIPPLVWIHGDEPLLVIESADLARRALREAGYQERQVFDVDRSFRLEALVAETRALSLFASNRILELRLAGKAGKELGQALADAAAAADEGTRLLVSGPRLDRTATGSAWFTQLDRAAFVVPVFPVERAQLPRWIAQRLAAAGQRADEATLEFLAERVEGNLLAAHQEIQKLGLLYPKGELSLEQIREAVLNVARYDVDSLREALLAGDVARLTRTLEGLQQEGEAPPLVLWAMSEEIRALALIKSGMERGQSADALLKEARVWGARQNLVKRALQRLPLARIEAALSHAGKIDRLIKGIGRGDAWGELLRLGLQLSAQPR